MDPALWVCVGEFVCAYAAIKRLGMDGWLAATGIAPDPDLLDRVVWFDAELDRLEFEDDVQDAMEEARNRR